MQTAERSPLAVIVTAVLAVGLVRSAGRFIGLIALLGVVIGCVAAFAIGITVLGLVLR